MEKSHILRSSSSGASHKVYSTPRQYCRISKKPKQANCAYIWFQALASSLIVFYSCLSKVPNTPLFCVMQVQCSGVQTGKRGILFRRAKPPWIPLSQQEECTYHWSLILTIQWPVHHRQHDLTFKCSVTCCIDLTEDKDFYTYSKVSDCVVQTNNDHWFDITCLDFGQKR